MWSGKAKDVLVLENEKVQINFRDSISAFDGVKKEELVDKGKTNCLTSVKLFELLNNYGFETHFISQINDTQILCEYVEILPVEVVCRNISAGSFCRRYGYEEGLVFDQPLVEFFVKDDAHHDPLITQAVAVQMKLISKMDAILMEAITRAVNEILVKVFGLISLQLVDFKLEFGRSKSGQLLLADEISLDTMRLWEKKTGEKKDKDRYRQDLGDVIVHYKNILDRLSNIKKLPDYNPISTARVIIKLKKSVLDPAGEVTFRSLSRKGYQNIDNVRLGKSAEIIFNAVPTSTIQLELEAISEKILSNPLIEDFEFKIQHHPEKSVEQQSLEE
ncbi:MAG: phosphoribosylaminoimidazolesuccinocarboxamide synthase [Candidatus Heimdallarchaeota archaeon]|nr:phosphoribosylaminoimidazolesuccinocarboxamide synthase [Candidatus Heimdallarchaeota archaeon]